MNCRDCKSWSELQLRAPGSLGGWMTESEREYLFQVAKAMQPGQRFMEIGVYGGTTLSVFAMMAPDDCEIIGMDSWENETPNVSRKTGDYIDLRGFCVENLEANGVVDRVKLFDGSSHLLGKSWDKALDVLIIDGDHTEAGAREDLDDFAKHVNLGGLLIVDDYWSSTDVKTAFDGWIAQPGGWSKVWGADSHVRNSGDGLISKLVAYRRVA